MPPIEKYMRRIPPGEKYKSINPTKPPAYFISYLFTNASADEFSQWPVFENGQQAARLLFAMDPDGNVDKTKPTARKIAIDTATNQQMFQAPHAGLGIGTKIAAIDGPVAIGDIKPGMALTESSSVVEVMGPYYAPAWELLLRDPTTGVRTSIVVQDGYPLLMTVNANTNAKLSAYEAKFVAEIDGPGTVHAGENVTVPMQQTVPFTSKGFSLLGFTGKNGQRFVVADVKSLGSQKVISVTASDGKLVLGEGAELTNNDASKGGCSCKDVYCYVKNWKMFNENEARICCHAAMELQASMMAFINKQNDQLDIEKGQLRCQL